MTLTGILEKMMIQIKQGTEMDKCAPPPPPGKKNVSYERFKFAKAIFFLFWVKMIFFTYLKIHLRPNYSNFLGNAIALLQDIKAIS